ncbi:MAG TPA: MarR family transcriptional regulator [Candidatus Limnocylindrales bacterium]|nr:MarR family transcriptional regulator [Candidatus Limnocylindrales bacterium]
MESVFNLSTQHRETDSKIVAALERLSQAFRILLWEQAKEHDLSPIQIQFLVYLLYHQQERVFLCRVSQLAREFDLTQATVSDAVKSLEEKNLVYREPYPGDKRIFTLRLTPQGKQLALKLSTWANVIKENVAQFCPKEQEIVLKFLMQLIASLQRAGIITISRMCITCRFFQPDAHPGTDSPHHCRLIDKPLANSELRIDCPEHEPLIGAKGQK